MWQPTHVKVTVKQARNLLTKGKNGTNDAFVVIGIGKEKYQTSVKEKSLCNVDWREECELAIPSQGNKAAVQLTVYHHNSLGLDEFLGQVALPLSDFDVYEKPKYRSCKLKGKPEKDKKKGEKERGELEVMVNFTVKSESFSDVNKKEKHKSSISSLKNLGGSLMSIGSKEKQGLKNFARSVSSKMDKIAKPRRKKSKATTVSSSLSNNLMSSQQRYGDADPGVISDEDDDEFRFDEDIRVNTRSSSPHSTMSMASSSMQDQNLEVDFDVGSYDEQSYGLSLSYGRSPPPKTPHIIDEIKERESTAGETFTRSFKPPSAERVTSFSDSNPHSSIKIITSTPELTASVIQEESSLELKSEPDDVVDVKRGSEEPYANEPSIYGSSFHSAKSEITSSSIFYSPYKEDKEIEDTSLIVQQHSAPQKLFEMPSNYDSEVTVSDELYTSSVYTKDGEDSAISVGNDQEMSLRSVSRPRSSSNASSAVSSLSNSSRRNSKDDLKMFVDETKKEKKLSKSSSAKDVTLRHGSIGSQWEKRIASATDGFSYNDSRTSTGARMSGDFSSASVSRTGSLSEKRSSEPLMDEWERKLYGRSGITGSTENMSMTGSRTSLNSRSSSTQEMKRDESFTRLPEVKAFTLERMQINEEVEEEEPRKQKKNKGISGLKHRFFHNKNGDGSHEKLNEDSRIVEGGNDRIPTFPTRSSRLPQEIHNRYAGKSREDLLEFILTLQSNLDKQLKHSNDLEDYIDNLLLRVMEVNPQILQAPVKKARAIKGFGPH